MDSGHLEVNHFLPNLPLAYLRLEESRNSKQYLFIILQLITQFKQLWLQPGLYSYPGMTWIVHERNHWATKLQANPLRPSLLSFLLPFWRVVRSYRPHLEVTDSIWGDDWSHRLHRLSRSWSFQLQGKYQDICAQPRYHVIILIIRRDWRDTRGKWPLARNPGKCWCFRHTSLKFFFYCSPWFRGQQERNYIKRNNKIEEAESE